MSGEGPESIPTSADPRSKRPVKKRALTPVSAQAASVDALFAHPDQATRLVAAAVRGAAREAAGGPPGAAPPEIVANVQGSSAGAGSGEFHVYKASRRREYERLRRMDAEKRHEDEAAEFTSSKAERDMRDEERTRRNREKRAKKKARQQDGPKSGGGGVDAAGKGSNGGGGDKWKGVKSAAAAAAAAARGENDSASPDGDHADHNGTPRDAPRAAVERTGPTPVAAEAAGLLIHDDD